MRIEQFNPRADDDALRACHQMHQAAEAHDDPDSPGMALSAFRNWWADGFTSNPQQTWLATGPDGPAGCYLLELPDRDNAATGFCLPVVPPARRRQGIGTALLAHCAGQARLAGRDLLAGHAVAASPGEAFARAAGGRGGLTDVRSTLAADAGLPVRLASLRALAEPHSPGYTLLSWRGPVPEAHLEQIAAVFSAISDAPRDDAIEPGRWDADRIRAGGERLAAHGLSQFSVAARREDSGELAALSQAVLDPDSPGWAFQQITVVSRHHRGHRLGLLIKAALYQWLLEADPGIRHITTLNAGANERMVTINQQLGFRPGTRIQEWTLPAAAVLPGQPAG